MTEGQAGNRDARYNRHDMDARFKQKLSSLTPVSQSRNLVREIGQRIAADISAGRLLPGTRLPTEQEHMAVLGVSRTVIREAVAMLRAEGLIATRQGIGSFVAEVPTRALFRIEPGQSETLSDSLDIMELRPAAETGGAGDTWTAPRDPLGAAGDRHRDRTRRGGDRRGFRFARRDHRRDRQSAVPPLSGIPRPLHHPAGERAYSSAEPSY